LETPFNRSAEVTFKPFHHLTLHVIEIETFGDSIRRIVLADPDGWDLPSFRAGAHIDIHIPNLGVRQYSLSSDPSVRDRYEIAVMAQREGRGGSRWMCDVLAVGNVVYASLPRNHFALDMTHEAFVLVAGGIGITPLRSMSFELERAERPYELWYCARDEASAAYVDELRVRIPANRLRLAFSRGPSGRFDLKSLLRKVPADTAIYCCGPIDFMNAVRDATLERPAGMVRFEAFSGSGPTGLRAERAFEVELARSGRSFPVRIGQTVLQAMRENGVDVDSSCEAGVCGSCRTNYLAGLPVHRDLILDTEERRTSMLVCVSGCSSERLVLDR
jgi:ferredoxin-NADP reductase